MPVTREVAIIQHEYNNGSCHECSQHMITRVTEWATVTEKEYWLLMKYCTRRGWYLFVKPNVPEVLMTVPLAIAEEAEYQVKLEEKRKLASEKKLLKAEQKRKKSEAEEKRLLRELQAKYGNNDPA